MNQINLGLRKVTVVSQSKDEIGVLVRTFTRMMDEINKLISQVYEAKIKLQKNRDESPFRRRLILIFSTILFLLLTGKPLRQTMRRLAGLRWHCLPIIAPA